MKKKISNKILELGVSGLAAVLLGAAACALAAYYILFLSGGFITSDTVDTLLWGQASWDSGKLFNPDFGYAALLPFGGNLLMWPLIGIFGVTVQAQVAGMFLFFLLFLAAALFFARQMGWSTGWSAGFAGILLMVLSSSAKLREIYWEHILYYSLGTLFALVGLGLFARWMDKSENGSQKGKLLTLGLLFLWCLLTGTDQMEILTLFLVPFLGAVLGERFFDIRGNLSKAGQENTWKAAAVIMAAIAGGVLLGFVLKGDMVAGYQNGYSGFSAVNKWLENAMKFPEHWFTLLGIEIKGGVTLASPGGIMILLRLLGAVTLIAAPAAAAICYRKIEDRKLRILILFHWMMTALLMVGYIAGKLSASNWRLSPLVASSVILSVAFGRWLSQRATGKRLALLALAPLVLMTMLSASDILGINVQEKKEQGLYQLSAELEEQGLDYGFATFWNANGLTVVSDSRIKARGVDLTEDGLKPITYQSNLQWFEDQPGQEEYFFLLEKKEYESLKKDHPLLTASHEKITLSQGYVALVYEENILRLITEGK